MSYHSLTESLIDNQVMLRIQYECKLKDDAIAKATKLIEELQEEIALLKEDKENLKKENAKKIVEIEGLHAKHKELECKITFLQGCLNQKDKQINQLYERINIKKQREERKFNNYLTISYEPQRQHKSEKKYKPSKPQKHLQLDNFYSTDSGGTPMRSTTKKCMMSTSPDQEPVRLSSISKQMIGLRRDLQAKDKQNLYLLKKNKAIQDYLAVLEDVNHSLLRRETPKINRGYLM